MIVHELVIALRSATDSALRKVHFAISYDARLIDKPGPRTLLSPTP
jgi:hypothetical protein